MSNRLRNITHLIVTIPFVLLLLCPVSSAAPNERIIKRSLLPDEPVDITGIKVKEAEVKFSEKFAEADNDWLSGITFTVKNTSEKHIGHLELLIEQPVSEALRLTIPIGTGHFSPLSQNVVGAAIALPGETIELRLSDESYKSFREAVPAEYKFIPITEVRVLVQRVVFTDGSMWYKGMLHNRDPRNPQRWYPAPGEKERFLEKMRGRRKAAFTLPGPAKYVKTSVVAVGSLKASQTYTCVNYYWTQFNVCGWCESRYGGEYEPCHAQTDVVGGQGEYQSYKTFTACYSFPCGMCGSSFTNKASHAGECTDV